MVIHRRIKFDHRYFPLLFENGTRFRWGRRDKDTKNRTYGGHIKYNARRERCSGVRRGHPETVSCPRNNVINDDICIPWCDCSNRRNCEGGRGGIRGKKPITAPPTADVLFTIVRAKYDVLLRMRRCAHHGVSQEINEKLRARARTKKKKTRFGSCAAAHTGRQFNRATT